MSEVVLDAFIEIPLTRRRLTQSMLLQATWLLGTTLQLAAPGVGTQRTRLISQYVFYSIRLPSKLLKEECQVIIDNMMNLEVLFASANLTGNDTLRQIAMSHADKTMQNHVRADGGLISFTCQKIHD